MIELVGKGYTMLTTLGNLSGSQKTRPRYKTVNSKNEVKLRWTNDIDITIGPFMLNY